jgi:hypothetical protein
LFLVINVTLIHFSLSINLHISWITLSPKIVYKNVQQLNLFFYNLFSAISWQEHVTFWWGDDDDVHFVLDQHD